MGEMYEALEISSYIWKYYNRRNRDLSIQVGYRGRKGSYATQQGFDYFQEQNWSLIVMTRAPWRLMKDEKSFTDNSKCFLWIFVVFCLTVGSFAGSFAGFIRFLITVILALPVRAVRKLWNKVLKGYAKVCKPLIIFGMFWVSLCVAAFHSDTAEPLETEEVSETAESSTGAETHISDEAAVPTASTAFDLLQIPVYAGSSYAVVNDNIPYFTEDEMTAESYEFYSELDALGRCGVCEASVGQDLMPEGERGEIGDIRPSGWHTVKYNGVIDGNYLYNRCHLIGWMLTGENSNTRNLITGTRYMNVKGMLPFENMVADYVKETGNHVMYRVTPIFEGQNLIASGVLMEAESVEDTGKGVLFNVYCYNVQPGIVIDYATGDSSLDGNEQEIVEENSTPSPASAAVAGGSYAVNGKNGKIHIVGACPATETGDNAMTSPVYFNSYEEAEAYSISIAPGQKKRNCGNCWKFALHYPEE